LISIDSNKNKDDSKDAHNIEESSNINSNTKNVNDKNKQNIQNKAVE
jgi:hypothetical protein